MIFRVIISDRAAADLRAIHRYVAKASSPDRAADLLASIVKQIDEFERMPDAYPRAGRRTATGDAVHTTHEFVSDLLWRRDVAAGRDHPDGSSRQPSPTASLRVSRDFRYNRRA